MVNCGGWNELCGLCFGCCIKQVMWGNPHISTHINYSHINTKQVTLGSHSLDPSHTSTGERHTYMPLNLICHNNRGITTWWIQPFFFSPLLSTVLPLFGNVDAVCNVCCSRWLKLNEWYNQRCWDYRGQNWCYLSNDVLFCGSEATNRKEKWSQHSVWFYSLSGERQIE